MSLLDRYSNGTLTGTSGPSIRRRRDILDNTSNLRPDNAGAFGDTYADATLDALTSGRNALVSKNTVVGQQTTSKYSANIFQLSNTATNNLVQKATTANTYGPGRFNSDPMTYTDRQFAIANASMGQAAATPSVMQAARQAALVITPVDPNIGTIAAVPFDDSRYVATIGYDYVLYTSRGSYS